MFKSSLNIQTYSCMTLILLLCMNAYPRDYLFSFGGGISKILNQGNGQVDLGFNGEFVGLMKCTNQIYLGGKTSYLNFQRDMKEMRKAFIDDYSDITASISILELTPLIRVFASSDTQPILRFYYQAGFGYFNYTDEIRVINYYGERESIAVITKKAGIDIGAGILFSIKNGAMLEIYPSYRLIFLTGGFKILALNINYVINRK